MSKLTGVGPRNAGSKNMAVKRLTTMQCCASHLQFFTFEKSDSKVQPDVRQSDERSDVDPTTSVVATQVISLHRGCFPAAKRLSHWRSTISLVDLAIIFARTPITLRTHPCCSNTPTFTRAVGRPSSSMCRFDKANWLRAFSARSHRPLSLQRHSYGLPSLASRILFPSL